MDESMLDKFGMSIKHNYLHMNHNMLDFGDLGAAAVPWPSGMPGFPQISKITNIVIHMYIIVFYGYPNLKGPFFWRKQKAPAAT